MIADALTELWIDVLAVSETLIREDAPNAIKYDLSHEGLWIIHEHRTLVDVEPKRGGGLAIIYSSELSAGKIKLPFRPIAFELQLTDLRVGNTQVVIANVHRPPSHPKSEFLKEFSDLKISTGMQARY